ncbi:MAG: ribonuclease HII [Thermoprotei archaeon]
MIIAGVDEAGRGPIVGPMVIAAVSGDEKAVEKLRELGVRDSKTLTPRKREELIPFILGIVKSVVFVVPPRVIDLNVKKSGGNLNDLEAFLMGEAISCLRPDEAIVDALGSEKKFADKVFLYSGIKVIARHDADSSCVLASTASVIAKVTRDRLVRCLPRAGSGYASDPYTKRFIDRVGKNPSFIRKTWG